MNISIHGVRGSIPTTNTDTKKYGGNTSCVEVEAEGWRLILDAGSGIQNINPVLAFHNNRVDILLTHLHMDHIQGLGFFRPLFNPDVEIHIWGPATSSQSLRARLGRYFSPPLFPVYFRNLTCKLVLHELEDSSFAIGPFAIESRYVIHPGPTLGFRIEYGKAAISYIPDHEPALGRNGLIEDTRWLSGSDLAMDADILIHDAQYTDDEYANRIGWGHSALSDTFRFAALNKVGKLLLTHHDPARSDQALDLLFAGYKEKSMQPFSFEMAYEGMQLVV